VKEGYSAQDYLTPQDFIESFEYYVYKDLSWFLGDIYNTIKRYDYSLKKNLYTQNKN